MGIGKTVSKPIKQRSPSKYLSLKYLEDVKDRYYCNQEACIDYVPEEVDSLIWEKQNKESERTNRKLEREYVVYEIEVLKTKKVKWCSKCRYDKPFTEFHIDKSKKTFGLRSHCKDCRKPQQEKKENDYRNAA